jgi:hypothetical protein
MTVAAAKNRHINNGVLTFGPAVRSVSPVMQPF